MSKLLMDQVLQALKNARAQVRVLGTPGDDINNAVLTELAEAIGMLEPTNPDADGFFYWDVRLGIHKVWVEDGADFTDDRAHDMLCHHFRYANGSELKATVTQRPPDQAVAIAQGFRSVTEYRKDRRLP